MEKESAKSSASYIEFLKAVKEQWPLVGDILLKYGTVLFTFMFQIIGKLKKADLVYAGIALLYWLSPIDLIPDFIPVVGYIDDMLVGLFCLMKILDKNVDIQDDFKEKLSQKDLSYDDLREKYETLRDRVSGLSSKIEEAITKRTKKSEELVKNKEKLAKTVIKVQKDVENQKLPGKDELDKIEEKLDKLLGDK